MGRFAVVRQELKRSFLEWSKLDAERDLMRIEKCTNQEIRPLFEGYMDYMSQFFKIENREAWHFKAMNYLSSYVDTSNRRIHGIKTSEVLIGFAMVNDELRFNDSGFAIAEFYIEKQHQAKGHGRELSEYVFGQIPGQWEVAVSRQNINAKRFWEQVIIEITSGEYRVIEFESRYVTLTLSVKRFASAIGTSQSVKN